MPGQFKNLSLCGGTVYSWDGAKQVGTPIPMCGRDDCEVCKRHAAAAKVKRCMLYASPVAGGMVMIEATPELRAQYPEAKVYAEDRHLDRVTAENSALQALLTEADERADVLEGLLLQTNELLYAIQGDPGAVPSSSIDSMRGRVFEALKRDRSTSVLHAVNFQPTP